MKILDPSFPKHEPNYAFGPDDRVFVPVLLKDELFDFDGELLCNHAYDSRGSAGTHFWFKTNSKVEIREMSVRDFLNTHDWQGMNYFETLNKREFLTAYRNKFPQL